MISNKNKCLLIPIILICLTYGGCGEAEESPPTASIGGSWLGYWASDKSANLGKLAAQITQNGPSLSGTLLFENSPCFFSATISSGSVSGNSASWSSPIGNFSGTAAGIAISGEYSVTSTDCAGDYGTFMIIAVTTTSINGTWNGTINLPNQSPVSFSMALTDEGSTTQPPKSNLHTINGTGSADGVPIAISGTINLNDISSAYPVLSLTLALSNGTNIDGCLNIFLSVSYLFLTPQIGGGVSGFTQPGVSSCLGSGSGTWTAEKQ
ncbi:MAG: hypothetical protein ACHQYP_01835 [Nitrospiria bacterium]